MLLGADREIQRLKRKRFAAPERFQHLQDQGLQRQGSYSFYLAPGILHP